MVVRRAAAAVGLLVLAGCGGADERPGDVRVQVGGQDVTARPVQYCEDGERVRYDNAPPVVEVSPDAVITLTVPEVIAERGWGVQVFDEGLEEILGEVDVPAGEDRLRRRSTPPTSSHRPSTSWSSRTRAATAASGPARGRWASSAPAATWAGRRPAAPHPRADGRRGQLSRSVATARSTEATLRDSDRSGCRP